MAPRFSAALLLPPTLDRSVFIPPHLHALISDDDRADLLVTHETDTDILLDEQTLLVRRLSHASYINASECTVLAHDRGPSCQETLGLAHTSLLQDVTEQLRA